MKKILFIIPTMEFGGAERVLSNILIHLNKSDYTPTLLLFNKKGYYLNLLPKDLSIIDLNCSHTKNPLNFFIRIFKLKQHLHSNKYDYVLSFTSISNLTVLITKLISKNTFIKNN